MSPLFDLPLGAEGARDFELRTGLDEEHLMADPETAGGRTSPPPAAGEDAIDYYLAAQHLLDAMPNPWRGREAAERVFGALLDRHPRERVAASYVFVLEELRKRLEAERDRLSQRVFRELPRRGDHALSRGGGRSGVQPPAPDHRDGGGQAGPNREDGGQYVLNLFERTNEDELNGLENKVATYLDQQERLFFWYRNRARKDYYVQGWKRGRIYADFIFTLKPDEPDRGDEYHQVFVVETKGLHLGQSADTAYKRSVFDLCSRHAKKQDWAEFVPSMRGRIMRFEIVDEDEWERRLNAMLAG